MQEHQADVARIMHARRTQTNEPGRCTALLAALPSGPLAIVEPGAAAGLCLLLDQYCYHYDEEVIGPVSSPVQLRCQVDGNAPLPDDVPEVVWRAGMDLSPVDVNSDDDAGWLLACVWPEHVERRARLQAAIQLARQMKFEIRQGNIVTDFHSLLADVPTDVRLVVFHSAVFCYLTQDERRSFTDMLIETSHERDIVWITNEAPSVIDEITQLAPPTHQARYLLGRTWLSRGRRRDELLATAQAHGAELTWLAEGEAAAAP